jgi:H+/Cl- antiporter ClcA
MLPKLLIILLLLAILGSLFSAVFFLVKDPADRSHRRTVRALTWRVILQVTLIAFLVIAFLRGWIQPHGVLERPGAAPSPPQSERPG